MEACEVEAVAAGAETVAVEAVEVLPRVALEAPSDCPSACHCLCRQGPGEVLWPGRIKKVEQLKTHSLAEKQDQECPQLLTVTPCQGHK